MTVNEGQKSNKTLRRKRAVRLIFDEVVIHLRRQTFWDDKDVFQAEIRQTPIPLQGGAFRVNSDKQIEAFQDLFKERVSFSRYFYNYTSPPNASDPQLEQIASDLAELGDKLYELLPISIRDELPRLIQEVFERGRGIRLIIEAPAGDQADRLLSLPWELLFIKETRVYPARSRRLLVVRRLLEAARQSSVEMSAPFDLIHLIADDPEQPIDLCLQKLERQNIKKAIAPGAYSSVEKPGSVQKLLSKLKEHPAQILHFLGHGGEPSQEENSFAARGYLRFVNEAGKPQWVTGERLHHLASGTPGLQLIVLNACQSASVISTNMALDLVYSGFPYVVAMQAQMPQEAAKHFIRAFYKELQVGRSIEEAVAASRFEIAAQLPGAIDWCLPVLYTNVGLAPKPPVQKMADNLAEPLFGQPEGSRRFGLANLILGGLHLLVGLLLLLSGTSQPLPDVPLIAATTGWLVIVPPLTVAWVLRSGEFESPEASRLALITRLLVSAAIGLGLPMLELLFLLILLAGLGFWASLSPPAQILLLLPLPIAPILLSYWTVRRHGLIFITEARIEAQTFDSGSLLMLLTGYLMLLSPIGFLYLAQLFGLTSPLANLIIGGLCIALGYSIRQKGVDE